jgi:hypothetical protein
MKSSHGRHGGNRGRTDKHEADQARSGGMAESLSGARDQEEAEGHTSGKD